MTREEAIDWMVFQKEQVLAKSGDKPGTLTVAYDMAIEALQAVPNNAVSLSLVDVYKWERDIALSQLEEYGIGFAEKRRDDLVEVVRCKGCRHANECHKSVQYTRNEPNTVTFGYLPIEWCSRGERREE